MPIAMRRQAAELRDQPINFGRALSVVHRAAQAFPQHFAIELPGRRVAQAAAFGVKAWIGVERSAMGLT